MTHSLKLDWAPRHAATARELEVLWVTFVKLQRLRLETVADLASEESTDTGDPHLLEEVLSPITDELYRLALAAAKVNAHCQDDLEYKAVILTEFISNEDETVRSALTRSLISDIKKSRCDLHATAQTDLQLFVASSA